MPPSRVQSCRVSTFSAAGPPGRKALYPHVVAVPSRAGLGGVVQFLVRLHIVPDELEFLGVDVPVERLDVLRLLADLDRVAGEDDRAKEIFVAGEFGEHPLKSAELFVIAEVHGRVASLWRCPRREHDRLHVRRPRAKPARGRNGRARSSETTGDSRACRLKTNPGSLRSAS